MEAPSSKMEVRDLLRVTRRTCAGDVSTVRLTQRENQLVLSTRRGDRVLPVADVTAAIRRYPSLHLARRSEKTTFLLAPHAVDLDGFLDTVRITGGHGMTNATTTNPTHQTGSRRRNSGRRRIVCKSETSPATWCAATTGA